MSQTLRLVSYNLLEGMRPAAPDSAERRHLDRGRVDAATAIVTQLAPDILVLNEALYCQPHEGRHVDYGDVFSFPHAASALYDGAWGNAILSRHPIVEHREMRIYNRGGLLVVIATPFGPLTVATYHPHPHRKPAHKADDFARLVAEIDGPAMVCGDLNCINPDDNVDREALTEAFRSFSKDAEGDVRRFIESGELVFRRLAQHGLHDAMPLAGRRHSMPTDLANTNKSSAMRIDHVLCNALIEIDAGEVVHSDLTNRASDHHPVTVDFRMPTV